jgi:hypothetical protein
MQYSVQTGILRILRGSYPFGHTNFANKTLVATGDNMFL